jgi:hypothetical protein
MAERTDPDRRGGNVIGVHDTSTIRGNTFHDNGGTFIDLDDDGPTANDFG